uniref:Uncharacterized protein n=1 Tax=Oryza glumipatula TaxID=40148 RepID=A0A0D9ZVK7_9ORYZ
MSHIRPARDMDPNTMGHIAATVDASYSSGRWGAAPAEERPSSWTDEPSEEADEDRDWDGNAEAAGAGRLLFSPPPPAMAAATLLLLFLSASSDAVAEVGT